MTGFDESKNNSHLMAFTCHSLKDMSAQSIQSHLDGIKIQPGLQRTSHTMHYNEQCVVAPRQRLYSVNTFTRNQHQELTAVLAALCGSANIRLLEEKSVELTQSNMLQSNMSKSNISQVKMNDTINCLPLVNFCPLI